MRPLVAVVGNNDLVPGDARDVMAEALGRALVDAGCRVTSGGQNGVMAAASRGARSSTAYREGDVLAFVPGMSHAEANPDVDIVIPTGVGYARNSIVALSHAVIAVGGGAGTLSEMAYAWQYDRLLISMRVGPGWSERLADQRLDERLRFSFIPDDCAHGASTAAEAVSILLEKLPVYLPGIFG